MYVEEVLLKMKVKFPRQDLKLKDIYEVLNSVHEIKDWEKSTAIFTSISSVWKASRNKDPPPKLRELLGTWVYSRLEDHAKFEASLVGRHESLRLKALDFQNESTLLSHTTQIPPRKFPKENQVNLNDSSLVS